MFTKVYSYFAGDGGEGSASDAGSSFASLRGSMGIESDSLDDLHRVEATRIVLFTWAELMKKKMEVGARIYEEVLLKEVGMSRLFLSTKIDAQADSFMHMLDSVIGYLDDPKTFDDKLRVLGEDHLTRLNVKKRHFKHFRQGFMQAIREYIPWSERREAAWLWFWNRVITGMTADTAVVPYARDLSPAEYMRRAHLIHGTFDAIMEADATGFGMRFYSKLLESQPDIAALFDSDKISVQAIKFIAMVRHTVNLLDDHRTFQFKLVELGRTHDLYGVKIPMLENFGGVLTDTLKSEESLAGKWTDEMDEVWSWFWKIVTELFTVGILERRKEQKEKLEYKPRSQLPAIDTSKADSSSSTSATDSASASGAESATAAADSSATDTTTTAESSTDATESPAVLQAAKPRSDPASGI